MDISILISVSKRYLDMISKDKDDKLIRIYFFICDKFEELQFLTLNRFCSPLHWSIL